MSGFANVATLIIEKQNRNDFCFPLFFSVLSSPILVSSSTRSSVQRYTRKNSSKNSSIIFSIPDHTLPRTFISLFFYRPSVLHIFILFFQLWFEIFLLCNLIFFICIFPSALRHPPYAIRHSPMIHHPPSAFRQTHLQVSSPRFTYIRPTSSVCINIVPPAEMSFSSPFKKVALLFNG